MNLGLQHKRVLITGGSKGIGLACAQVFAQAGAQIAIASRDSSNLDAAKQQLAQSDIDVHTFVADLCQPQQAQDLIQQFEHTLGPLDILLNAAGAAKRYPPLDLTPEAWTEAMQAKYFTYIYTMDAALVSMRKRKQGNIVNIIGAGGKHPSPMHLPGGAANAALMLATAGLATTWASHGIRINAINPGATSTDRIQGSINAEAKMTGQSTEQVFHALHQRIPMGRLAKPEEIANVALFLASDLASYVTGAQITMTGGADPSVI